MLHDHLDGGLRPQTIIDIAREINYEKLPSYDANELATWFRAACDSGSLVEYLETFEHTISVMQTEEHIKRVAREAVLDLARDGVVWAELRGAPELFTRKGLTIDQVIEATLAGYQEGEKLAAAEGLFIKTGSILCAMRQNNLALEIAEEVVKYRDQGVVGFDIAGPEDGFPPTRQIEAFEYLRKENMPFTIHAGEAFGLPSIWEAIQLCGTQRVGHGVHIADDIDFSSNPPKLGRLAQYVRDRRIPLELCPTSNLQTGIAQDYFGHPINNLWKLGFTVTINTDNRLMSRTSLSNEIYQCVKAFNWDLATIQEIVINAMKNAFTSVEVQNHIIENIITKRFAEILNN